jgi:predicted amidophosphoribosyltransferase
MTFQLPVTLPARAACTHQQAEPCLACALPRLERPDPGACPVCSQRIPPGGRCPNELCHSRQRRVSRIHAIAYQSGSLRGAIYAYKYRDVRDWALTFGQLLLAWLDETLTGDPPDLIVANPSFVGPGGQRFAHTEAVLDAAAKQARGRSSAGPGWRIDTGTPRAIVKSRATLQSADMEAWSKSASAADLLDALRVPDPARTTGKNVLVYDDICTTGRQADAVAGCLLDQGGAARVEAVVLARAPWRR